MPGVPMQFTYVNMRRLAFIGRYLQLEVALDLFLGPDSILVHGVCARFALGTTMAAQCQASMDWLRVIRQRMSE